MPRTGSRRIWDGSFARYAAGEFLASGWAYGGERYLVGQPAGVPVPLGTNQTARRQRLRTSGRWKHLYHNRRRVMFERVPGD